MSAELVDDMGAGVILAVPGLDGAVRGIRIHVSGSDFLTRLGLSELFNGAGGIIVTGSSRSLDESMHGVARERPDIVLVHAHAGHDISTVLATALRCWNPMPKVVVLAEGTSLDCLEDIIAVGAAAVLDKDRIGQDLVHVLRMVHEGTTVYARRPRTRLLISSQGSTDNEMFGSISALDVSARRLAKSVALGQTNAEIAARVHLSEATIKAHITRLLKQLGLVNRVQLAVAVARAGLLDGN